ncbi:MAG TPA: DUF1360 domain-containing protein [Bryobacteraceae bacterium]|nr:DUF1360 domain-containing protein [Bryobacteraceae bacterium]
MSELGFWPRFVLSVLAVWRVSHLLAREDGPWDLIYRLRRRMGDSTLGRLMDCFYCLSLWVALPFTFFVAGAWSNRAIVWLALSGAACLLERLIERPTPSVSLQEDSHAVLWSETGRSGEFAPPAGRRPGSPSRFAH